MSNRDDSLSTTQKEILTRVIKQAAGQFLGSCCLCCHYVLSFCVLYDMHDRLESYDKLHMHGS